MGGRYTASGDARYEVDSVSSTHSWSDGNHMTSEGNHYHSYTPSGSISGGSYSFSGTASNTGTTAPTFTGTASNTGNKQPTFTGTAGTTGSTGSSSVSVLNPYYAVYIWVRTA